MSLPDLGRLTIEIVYNLLMSGLILSHSPATNGSTVGAPQREAFPTASTHSISPKNHLATKVALSHLGQFAEVQALPNCPKLIRRLGGDVHRRSWRGGNGG